MTQRRNRCGVEPRDGTPLIGKTGTARGVPDLDDRVEHEGRDRGLGRQLDGEGDIFERYFNGVQCRSCATRSPADPARRERRLRRRPVPGRGLEPDASGADATCRTSSACRVDQATATLDDGGLRRHRRRRPSTPPRPPASSPRRTRARARSRRHDGDDQPQQRPGCRRAGCRGQAAQSGGRASCAPPASATSSPARARWTRRPAASGKATGTNPAGGHRREPQRGDHGRLQPRPSATSDAPAQAQDRPHRARRGGGGRRGRRDLGHRHRALPVHGPRARAAHPARRAPRPSACCTSPTPTWRRGSAASSGGSPRWPIAGARPHRQHRRQPRPRATGCAASASRSTRCAASPASSCTDPTTTPRRRRATRSGTSPVRRSVKSTERAARHAGARRLPGR